MLGVLKILILDSPRCTHATTLADVNQRTVETDDPDQAVATTLGDVEIIENDWSGFLEKHMETLGWDNLRLAAESNIDRSQVSRWLRGEGHPRNDKIRSVCRALRLDVRYGIVAAGYFTPEEMRLRTRRESVKAVLRGCSPQELTEELLSRIPGDEPEPAVPADEPVAPVNGAVGPFTEQHRAVVAPITFQDGRQNGRAS